VAAGRDTGSCPGYVLAFLVGGVVSLVVISLAVYLASRPVS
jgi:hypothetical protein